VDHVGVPRRGRGASDGRRVPRRRLSEERGATMPAVTDRRPAPNGSPPAADPSPRKLGVAPPTSPRRQRLPELAVGVLLVVGCALAALMLAAGDRDRTPVVALSGDVSRGDVLTADDLSTVYVESDASIAATPEDDRDDLVGLAALSDLP